MDENEPLDHAAARELKEETSLDASQSGVVLEQVHRPSHSQCIMLISDPSCISTALAAHMPSSCCTHDLTCHRQLDVDVRVCD